MFSFCFVLLLNRNLMFCHSCKHLEITTQSFSLKRPWKCLTAFQHYGKTHNSKLQHKKIVNKAGADKNNSLQRYERLKSSPNSDKRKYIEFCWLGKFQGLDTEMKKCCLLTGPKELRGKTLVLCLYWIQFYFIVYLVVWKEKKKVFRAFHNFEWDNLFLLRPVNHKLTKQHRNIGK